MCRTFILVTALFGSVAGCSPVDEKAAKEADEEWIQAHGNDAKAMNERFGSKARIACAVRVDDYLRSIAKYDFAWDDDAKGYSGKFTKYAVQSIGLGMMTEISDKAKLSNRFGAFEHVPIYCLYNAVTDEVVSFSTYNPYLDTLMPDNSEDQADAENWSKSNIVIYDANSAVNAVQPANETSLPLIEQSEKQSENTFEGKPTI